MKRLLAAFGLAALLASPVLAIRRADEPLPLAFRPVPAVPDDRRPSVGAVGRVGGERLLPTLPSDGPPFRSGAVRPVVPVPTPRLIVVPRPDRPTDHGSAQTRTGPASWYCGHGSACTRGYSGGLYAAAGPVLRRTAGWRGSYVEVVADGRALRVRLIDWCACPGGRLLDLYSDAFERLGPLSRGVLAVEVRW